MSPGPRYSFTLTEAELGRYRAMAALAREHEGQAWAAAGIVAGATVADLGCGPGTFLPVLASLVGEGGRVIGVDRSDDAIGKAGALVEQLRLSEYVELRCGPCNATDIAVSSLDAVFMRNVLVHNGPVLGAVLGHVATLLRPGGRALFAEPDLTALVLPDHAPEEQELEARWRDWMIAVGNDPALGRHLSSAITAGGFDVLDVVNHLDTFEVERSPALTAGHLLIEAGLATSDDVERWHAAAERRLVHFGPMRVSLPTTAVVAAPAPRDRPRSMPAAC